MLLVTLFSLLLAYVVLIKHSWQSFIHLRVMLNIFAGIWLTACNFSEKWSTSQFETVWVGSQEQWSWADWQTCSPILIRVGLDFLHSWTLWCNMHRSLHTILDVECAFQSMALKWDKRMFWFSSQIIQVTTHSFLFLAGIVIKKAGDLANLLHSTPLAGLKTSFVIQAKASQQQQWKKSPCVPQTWGECQPLPNSSDTAAFWLWNSFN